MPWTASKKIILIAMLIFLCYEQNWLLEKINFFSYLDEIIALVCLLYYFMYKYYNNNLGRGEDCLFILSFILIAYGGLFNYLFAIQTNYIAIIEDIFSLFKFLFVFLGTSCYLKGHDIDVTKLLNIIEPILKIYLVVLCFFALINLKKDIGVSTEVRYGIRNFAFFYGTPGHIINQMTYSLMLLSARKKIKKNFFWIAICLLISALTLKTRAFLLILIYCSLIYFIVIKKRKKIGIQVLFVLIMVAIAGYSQFKYYFITGLTSAGNITPRRRFVISAIQIVKQYFPFGTGFATFGSSAAAEYYSPLYVQLGWSHYYGMSPDSQDYLNDNYLPMIFAQFGFFIGIIFLVFIFFYCRIIWKKVTYYYKDNKASGIVRAMTLFYILDIVLSSVQSSYMSHYSAVTLTLIYLLCYYPRKNNGY